jgi:hypothetical protein
MEEEQMAAVMAATRHRDGWLGAEFDRAALYWDFTPAHLGAIDELMEKLACDKRPFHRITKHDFSHPALDADLAKLLAYIKTGPGLVVMRGFPVDKYTPEEMQTVYWGIGAHFGVGCSQSADGDYLGYVTNVAKASRGYTTDRELNLHTDSAEIVGPPHAGTPPTASLISTPTRPRSLAFCACVTPRKAARASMPAP